MASEAKKTLDFKKSNLALAQSPIPIVVTDPMAKIIFANKGIESMTGYSIEEVLGKTPAIWGGQMSKNFYANLWDTIETQKKVFLGELTNRNKNGQLYPIQLEIAPVLNKEGEIEFFIGTYQDIGKIKEARRVQSEFVALASHQLRTPLTAVKWLIEVLLREKYGILTDKQEEAMINIYNSNERLIKLVNDLLNVSKVESGNITVLLSPIDIIKHTKEIIKTYRPLARSKKKRIVFNYDKNLKIAIVDPVLYSQAIQNLLSNALIYGSANSNVIVSLDKEKDLIIARVTNFGDPIPLTEQKNLFTKFFRGEQAQKADTHGSGLGLFIVKESVEKIGGKVGFSSTKEKTEFHFTFPLKEPAAKLVSKKKV